LDIHESDEQRNPSNWEEDCTRRDRRREEREEEKGDEGSGDEGLVERMGW